MAGSSSRSEAPKWPASRFRAAVASPLAPARSPGTTSTARSCTTSPPRAMATTEPWLMAPETISPAVVQPTTAAGAKARSMSAASSAPG